MNDNERKRLLIFERYSKNLHFLVANKIIGHITLLYDETYICPICKDQFCKNDLNQTSSNPLTLEDVPPKSLGGKSNILTCWNCNNHCGREIDFHLAQKMNELDMHEFRPGVEFNAKLAKDSKIVQGSIKVNADGTMTVKHKAKQNNPSSFNDYIQDVKKDEIVNIQIPKSKFDETKSQLALLKIGFLSMFVKYGYSFILNNQYDIIRNQLLNPSKQIYPIDFSVQAPFPKIHFGVPFIIEPKLEAIFPIFSLKTDHSERTYGLIMPLTYRSIEATISALKLRFKQTRTFEMQMDGMVGVNYLEDKDRIIQMLNWIKTF